MKPGLPIRHGRLRPATARDLDSLVALLHDEQVRRYLCDDTVLPRAAIADMLKRSAQLDPRGLGLWAIETGEVAFAGIAGLEPVSPEVAAAPQMAGGIEPVVALDPAHWGTGLAHAALDALITHAGGPLALSGLVAAVDRPNDRSHRLMQRCGFAETGRMPGPANDLILYTRALAPEAG